MATVEYEYEVNSENTNNLESSNPPAIVDTAELNKESLELLNQIIAEVDIEKTKDLTYLFNLNQNKKTMVRVNKLSDLLDVVTEQALARFTTRPHEISNKELLDSLKTVQELIERSQKQVSGVSDTPLIQINQQTNSVNVGESAIAGGLNRESRERVQKAVSALLKDLTANERIAPVINADIIEVSEDQEGE